MLAYGHHQSKSILPHADAARQLAERRDRRVAWALWALFLITICLFIAAGSNRSVTPAYAKGARAWIAGRTIYNNEGTGFLYLPTAAVIFIPFAVLPTLVADLLWRCFTIGCYAWGTYRLAVLAEKSSHVPLFGLASMVTMPLAWASAQNGQATLPMAGLMMAGVALIAERRWWFAAGCLTLALSVKPLAIVLILLSLALYRPLIGRLAVTLSIALAVPFLAQNPAYVQAQYVGLTRMLQLASDHSNIVYFAQVFGLLRVMGLDVPMSAQTLVRAGFGAVTLLLCLWYCRRLEADRWATYFYAISSCYLVLFNPRTENNTYSLLAPAVAIFLAESIRVERSQLRTAWLALIAVGILGTYEIGRLVTSPAQAIWLAPLAAIAFAGCVVIDLIRSGASARLAISPGLDAPSAWRSST